MYRSGIYTQIYICICSQWISTLSIMDLRLLCILMLGCCLMADGIGLKSSRTILSLNICFLCLRFLNNKKEYFKSLKYDSCNLRSVFVWVCVLISVRNVSIVLCRWWHLDMVYLVKQNIHQRVTTKIIYVLCSLGCWYGNSISIYYLYSIWF